MAAWTDQQIMFATLLLFMAHGRSKPVDDALPDIERALDGAQKSNTLVQGLPTPIEVVATMSSIGYEIDHPDATLMLLAHTATLAQLSASNIAEDLLPDRVLTLDELLLHQGSKKPVRRADAGSVLRFRRVNTGAPKDINTLTWMPENDLRRQHSRPNPVQALQTPMSHNHLRITGNIKSLYLCGQTELAHKFQAAVIRLGKEHVQVLNQNLGYWQRAITTLPSSTQL